MKNREVDLLIVVNMFLTGFDATTLNTLWVDKKKFLNKLFPTGMMFSLLIIIAEEIVIKSLQYVWHKLRHFGR